MALLRKPRYRLHFIILVITLGKHSICLSIESATVPGTTILRISVTSSKRALFPVRVVMAGFFWTSRVRYEITFQSQGSNSKNSCKHHVSIRFKNNMLYLPGRVNFARALRLSVFANCNGFSVDMVSILFWELLRAHQNSISGAPKKLA